MGLIFIKKVLIFDSLFRAQILHYLDKNAKDVGIFVYTISVKNP